MTQTAFADAPGAFRSRPVEVSYELDAGPGDYRIGLLALSNDYVTERDFMNMRPGDGVAIYTNRLLNSSDCTVETLRALAPRLTEATALLGFVSSTKKKTSSFSMSVYSSWNWNIVPTVAVKSGISLRNG